MSAFSKKYYSPKNAEVFLFVSWDTGYRNIQIFYQDRLIHTIQQPTVLVKGIKIQDDELGTIKCSFTTTRPRKLEIKVNNKKFKTVNKLNLGYDYTGLIAIFTTLAVLAAMEIVIFGGMFGFNFSYPLFSIVFISGFIITVLYGVTSYLLSKKKPWAYFIGTSIFVITTLISILGVSLIFSSLANTIVLFFRFGILIYILIQIKHILKEMKRATISNHEDDLLDSTGTM